MMRPAAAALALCLCACDDAAPATGPLRHAERMSIWTEYPSAAEAEADVAFAAQNGLNLNLVMVRGMHGRELLAAYCPAAERADVALRLWPNVEMDNGYWPGQGNVDEFLAWMDELGALAAEECPRLDGYAIDLEMPFDRIGELQAMVAGGTAVPDLADWLVGGIDEAAFERARGLYREMVVDLHVQGYRVYLTTLPMIADDFADGDETLAQIFWTPVEGIDWDVASFQVYRTLYDTQFAPLTADPEATFSSGLVSSYADSIVAAWGPRGAVDLGTTGSGIGIEAGLASAAELQADIAAALAAGIPAGQIAIYSLDGLDDKSDAPAWVTVPAPLAAEVDAPTEEVRGAFAALDSLTPR